MKRGRLDNGGGVGEGLNLRNGNVVVMEKSSKKPKSLLRKLIIQIHPHRALVSLLCVLTIAGSMIDIGWKGARKTSKVMHIRKEDALAAASALIKRDYSTIKSVSDLSVDGVRQCAGNTQKCKCPSDTTLPSHRIGHRQWSAATHNNKDFAREAAKKEYPPDVVFYGDGIIEGWRGTALGNHNGRRIGVPEVFDKLFNRKNGAKYQGLPLGVAGDTTTNLLYRLQNGELPPSLLESHPKVIWVLIASDDLFTNYCSAEMTLIGILRIILEIKQRIEEYGSTNATSIVIDAILPRTFNQEGYVMRGGPRTPKRRNGPYVPSLYSHIIAINEQLERYAKNNDNVYYFEPNDFWLDHDAPDELLQINPALMPDYSHPSVEGYELWGKEIIKRLDGILLKSP